MSAIAKYLWNRVGSSSGSRPNNQIGFNTNYTYNRDPVCTHRTSVYLHNFWQHLTSCSWVLLQEDAKLITQVVWSLLGLGVLQTSQRFLPEILPHLSFAAVPLAAVLLGLFTRTRSVASGALTWSVTAVSALASSVLASSGGMLYQFLDATPDVNIQILARFLASTFIWHPHFVLALLFWIAAMAGEADLDPDHA